MPAPGLRLLYENSLSSNPAGTGVFVRGLLAGLRRLDGVDVVCAVPEGRAVVALDVGRKSLGRRARNGFDHLRYYLYGLPRRARAAGCQAILCPTALGPMRGSTPTVITLFDLSPVAFPETLDWLSRHYLRTMIAMGVRHAAAVCTISEVVARELLGHYRNLRPERLHVAYPAADPALLEAQSRPAFEKGPPFVLMVGTLEPRKNHITVLRALAEHRRRHPSSPLELVLAGSAGWRYRPALQTIEDLGLTPWVRRLGIVEPATLKWLYQHAAALLFPSLYEGFGLPVLEAFHLRCPVVGADIPSVRELAGPATALLLSPTDVSAWANALDTVASRDASRLALAWERAQHFTWEACARSAVVAVEQALAS